MDFFIDAEPRTTLLTRLNYACDLRVFFRYLQQTREGLADKPPRDYDLQDIKSITSREISYYLEYLSLYKYQAETEDAPVIIRSNQNSGKKRKLIALRSFFKFLQNHGYISQNPAAVIQIPKLHDKPIVYLEMPDAQRLISLVETGEALTENEKRFHRKTQVRDSAIVTLLLGTGIRVAECVSLDINSIDFSENRFLVTRKGGDSMYLYFNRQVHDVMYTYYLQRKSIIPVKGHERAFFLSLQKRRITTRAVEKLVEKYTKGLQITAHITPHKLRSTFGTNLYRKTGDIYLVADVLGHKDVNVTKRHYASIDERKRRLAADLIDLTPREIDDSDSVNPESPKDPPELHQ
ncbi:MAG: tyrosine-type recombinase/integrase [Christensenellales bacterium]|jgi:integrase/recombinase XerC